MINYLCKNYMGIDKDIDFIEYATEDDDKGCNLFKFKILKELNDKDKVSYKIMSTVYSYDHIENLLKNFKDEISDNEQKLKNYEKRIEDMEQKIKDYTEDIREHIEILSNIETNLDSKYLKKDIKINKDNLAKELYEGIAINIINEVLTVPNGVRKIEVTDLFSNNDLVNIYDVTSNKILIRDIDYEIVIENTKSYLNIIDPNVSDIDQLYVSGIRFNKA